MADIIIKDSSGAPHTYTGVESVSYPTTEGGIARFRINTFEITHGTFKTGTVDDGGVFQKEIKHGMSKRPDLIIVHAGYPQFSGVSGSDGGFDEFFKEYPQPLYFAWGILESFPGDVRGGICQIGLGFTTSDGYDRTTAPYICSWDERTFRVGKRQADDTETTPGARFLPNASYFWFAFRGLASDE